MNSRIREMTLSPCAQGLEFPVDSRGCEDGINVENRERFSREGRTETKQKSKVEMSFAGAIIWIMF